MLPSEEIINAYYMERLRQDRSTNRCILFSPYLEYFVDKDNWIVLQTESTYILIGASGVSFVDSLEEYRNPQYDIIDASDETASPPIRSFLSLLFNGEHLIDVQKNEDSYLLTFDHFKLSVFPYLSDYYWSPGGQSLYVPFHCFDRYIAKAKCDCGGHPEIMLDHAEDFFVRCDSCHKATWATWYLPTVVDDWNSGNTPTIINTGNEVFSLSSAQTIKMIAMHKESSCYDDNLYDCKSALIEYENKTFEITAQLVGEDEYDFRFHELSAFNPAHWPYRFLSTDETPITFMGMESGEDQYHLLRYQIGKRQLIITADEHNIVSFGWVHEGRNGEALEADGTLFNDILD